VNTGNNVLVGTFIAPSGLDALNGLTAQIDVTSDGPLPDWWKLGSTDCRPTSLSANFDFTIGPFNCYDYWRGGAVGAVNYTVLGPSRACLTLVCALPSGDQRIGPIPAGTEVYGFKIVINNTRTVGAGACAGCTTPICITLNSIALSQPPEYPDLYIFDPDIRNFATWQGGTASCPTTPQSMVSIGDASVTEGNGGTSTMTFSVARGSSTNCEVNALRSVAYSIVPGSATANDDYAPSSGVVQLPSGNGSVNVEVTVNGDGTPEADETFMVNLHTPRGVTIGDGQGVGTILNDDNSTAAPPGAAETRIGASPNPFRESVEVGFSLTSGALIRLDVHDVSGRLVRASPPTYLPAGPHRLAWDGRGDDGSPKASGVYWVRVTGQGVDIARRVVRLK
jgi:hypothetical protein